MKTFKSQDDKTARIETDEVPSIFELRAELKKKKDQEKILNEENKNEK